MLVSNVHTVDLLVEVDLELAVEVVVLNVVVVDLLVEVALELDLEVAKVVS